MLGCRWYNNQCIDARQYNELYDFVVCLNNTGILKDKCEWFTRDSGTRYCRSNQSSAENCNDNLNSEDCQRSVLGCKWYKDECINAEKCNELIDFSV